MISNGHANQIISYFLYYFHYVELNECICDWNSIYFVCFCCWVACSFLDKGNLVKYDVGIFFEKTDFIFMSVCILERIESQLTNHKMHIEIFQDHWQQKCVESCCRCRTKCFHLRFSVVRSAELSSL